MTEPFNPTGHAFLFSYPFWIFVNKELPPLVKEFQFEGTQVRLYTPFRSGPANHTPMPPIDLNSIPYVQETKVEMSRNFSLPQTSYVPSLELDAEGKGACKLFSTPDWGKEWEELKDRPMDSLRVDVFDADEHKGFSLSVKIADELIQLLRWRTNQWWISRSSGAILKPLRNTVPITQDRASFRETGGYIGFTFAMSGDEQGLTNDLWSLVIEDLIRGVKVPIHDVILNDAKYFSAVGDVRRSVLDSVTGCEQAKNVTYERLWRERKTGKFKVRAVFKGSVNLPDHLDTLLEQHFGRSYKKEHPDNFTEIEQLWLARGNVAHGGQTEFWWNNTKIVVDQSKATTFAQAAWHCARWLTAI